MTHKLKEALKIMREFQADIEPDIGNCKISIIYVATDGEISMRVEPEKHNFPAYTIPLEESIMALGDSRIKTYVQSCFIGWLLKQIPEKSKKS